MREWRVASKAVFIGVGGNRHTVYREFLWINAGTPSEPKWLATPTRRLRLADGRTVCEVADGSLFVDGTDERLHPVL